MTTGVASKQRAMEAAVKAADSIIQDVYRVQNAREQAGEIPYDARRNARVIFSPKSDGTYTAELRPVLLSGIKEAAEAGADFWHPTRGWIRYGRKPETEYGQTVHFAEPEEASAAVGETKE